MVCDSKKVEPRESVSFANLTSRWPNGEEG